MMDREPDNKIEEPEQPVRPRQGGKRVAPRQEEGSETYQNVRTLVSVLAVLIHPHPTAPGATPFTREEARESCKPPVTYSWDWNPFLPISGLWKPAYVETRTADYIRSCEPFYTLDVENKTAEIWFEADCDAPVEYTLWDADGNVLYTGTEGKISLTDVAIAVAL